jgi:AraC-like DNA-binding protein
MQVVLGKSPLSYIQSLRVECVDEVAAHVGYTESSILRVLLLRCLGLGIKEIRRSA